MAKIISTVAKITCSICGKGLGTYISVSDFRSHPSILPALLPKEAYTREAITSADIQGASYPIMCSECEAKQVKKKEDIYTSFTPDFHAGWEMVKRAQEAKKNEASSSENGTERA